ncbi:dTDP-4-dehydrorhamnose reductase [Flavobacterium sp. DG1-102-2]|uniref:dTDP-4-dehydrorhamnose reductase n=1 Tax=Flavobacterium sp. DG1-102-2 TaxID=3081663 RepID=UPI0029495D1E|nr:dTDP-4-dehydrorhamnose reductase [Flavobacterium sp. DG1-102-2]MDV6168370.1 dTDP-4-dehydrorhamnose reductase [Flavobacterium sp. DG1-102-2]
MKKVLVTGGNGQLGLCIKSLEKDLGIDNQFIYLTSKEMDVTNAESINTAIASHNPSYIINCAAYTAVDKAETEKEATYLVNATGPELLAKACKNKNIVLIHISTDFVFGDTRPLPLTEDMETTPTGVYGASKLAGEKHITENMSDYFIIRTSWLYSEFQNNFLKTMLRLGNEKDEVSVVYDQAGTPTYAVDLAEFIYHIINTDSTKFGLYHYSNEGVASWYDFAFEIFKLNGIKINLKPITSDKFPTAVKRPNYSVMAKDKVKDNFNVTVKHWTTSVADCLTKI